MAPLIWAAWDIDNQGGQNPKIIPGANPGPTTDRDFFVAGGVREVF